MRNVVVVGAGSCGFSAVDALRAAGFDGRITLIGEEHHLPYERPPLSKTYLWGEKPAEHLSFEAPGWYEDNAVQTRFGSRVIDARPADREVVLQDGHLERWDALLIATGARPRRIPSTGDRILYLRTIDDAERIRPYLLPGRHLIVIGSGFVGSEIAATARSLGTEVTLIEAEEVPLLRSLGLEVGRVFADIHKDHGVLVRTNEAVEDVEETLDGVCVRTTKGTIEGDAVLVGIGVEPNVGFASNLGLRLRNGIVVDQNCRTNVDGVFAAGDVANQHHPLFDRLLRIEHFENAVKQGAAAAKNMLGMNATLQGPPWFWSDQYDHNLQSIGITEGYEEFVLRGSLADRHFLAFYIKAGRVVGAVGLDRGNDVRRASSLIGTRAAPALLRDESVALNSLTVAKGGVDVAV